MERDELFKEIDLIQGCINRMSRNSFMVKGWTLTVFAGVIAISKAAVVNDLCLLICTVIVPLVCFWLLDAFFLHAEKEYRAMYKWMLEERAKGNNELQYDLDPKRFNEYAGSVARAAFSKTMIFFYLIPVMAICGLIIRLIC